MEVQFPAVDQALETSVGADLPWGRVEAMIVRSRAEDDAALVVLELSVSRPESHGGISPGRRSSRPWTHQRLGRLVSAAFGSLAVMSFGPENWAPSLLAGAVAGVSASRAGRSYGLPDEAAELFTEETRRSVGVAVQIDTATFEPAEFYGDIDQFEDVVGEINVAAVFSECRDEALVRAWEAACLDNAATPRPTDDPDDWWAYWLAYRAVTRQNRRNAV